MSFLFFSLHRSHRPSSLVPIVNVVILAPPTSTSLGCSVYDVSVLPHAHLYEGFNVLQIRWLIFSSHTPLSRFSAAFLPLFSLSRYDSVPLVRVSLVRVYWLVCLSLFVLNLLNTVAAVVVVAAYFCSLRVRAVRCVFGLVCLRLYMELETHAHTRLFASPYPHSTQRHRHESYSPCPFAMRGIQTWIPTLNCLHSFQIYAAVVSLLFFRPFFSVVWFWFVRRRPRPRPRRRSATLSSAPCCFGESLFDLV